MTKLDLVRAVSAAAAVAAAPVALAEVTLAAEPSFAISSTGIWSIIGVAIGAAALIWAMRKVT